jgi:hypothetical protein
MGVLKSDHGFTQIVGEPIGQVFEALATKEEVVGGQQADDASHHGSDNGVDERNEIKF